jgi:hypothetical protein
MKARDFGVVFCGKRHGHPNGGFGECGSVGWHQYMFEHASSMR